MFVRNSCPSGGLSILTDPKTGEIRYKLDSWAIFTVDEFGNRVRKVLATKSATYFTGSLAEDHLAELFRRNEMNSEVTIVDKFQGSVPDILLNHGPNGYMVEVKTTALENQLVIKYNQLERFAEMEDCFYAFTEHNIQGIRQALKKRGGHGAMANSFRLRRIVIVSTKVVACISSQWKSYPYGDSSRWSYITVRINSILKWALQMGYLVKRNGDSEIYTIGEVPDFFPSSEISRDFLGEACFDFGGFPKIDPRNL